MADGQARGVDSFLPRDLHVIELSDVQVLDLTGEGSLRRVGLSMDDVQSDDRAACQAVGEAAHYLAMQGILAPSATSAGIVLALFQPALKRGQLRVLETQPLRIDRG